MPTVSPPARLDRAHGTSELLVGSIGRSPLSSRLILQNASHQIASGSENA